MIRKLGLYLVLGISVVVPDFLMWQNPLLDVTIGSNHEFAKAVLNDELADSPQSGFGMKIQ